MNAKCRDLSGDAKEPVRTSAACSQQPHQVFRSDTRWGRSVIEWPSLDAFLSAAEVHSGFHSVPIGEFSGKQIDYDFLLTARPGTALLCHFHGNTPRAKMGLPVITGLGVTSSIATSMFVPSDPVLSLDASLSLAWHFGCEGIPLQAITASIVQKLQAILHAPRVVTWGGSGGGFAAIRIAKDVQNSIALVWNPQTDIAKYVQGPVSHYRRIAFPTIASEGAFPSGKEQFPSLCTEEFCGGYKGRILYLQESTDWHVKGHLAPFLSKFCRKVLSDITGSSTFSGLVADRLYLHLDRWGNGHVPPSKEVLSKVLGLLSDVTTNGENVENLASFPGEVIQYIKSNLSQQVQGPVMKIAGEIGPDPLGSASTTDSPLDYKEILAIGMDLIADDFSPFDGTVKYSGDTVTLPLFTGEIIEVSLAHGVQWDRTFATQANSSVMHLFSLAPIGRLLSTFQKRKDTGAFQFAVVALTSFLDYSREPAHQSCIGRMPSADHAAATRVRVLVKFIQVVRERQDVDDALLVRVCDCLKYWSDWLSEAKNYRKHNHGLMGSIALLHSTIQFGAAPWARAYLDVAADRIIELAKSSFDQDGLCNENTIGYHNFNLSLYRGLANFCKHYRLSETLSNFLDKTIACATKAVEFCVWQDGSIPPLGDSGVYRRNIPSRNEPKCFYESGFAVVKNDDLYLSLICGARSEIHKHVDDLSMTLRFRNRDILIDGGSYLYDRADPYRRCVESSFGHSGLFLKEFDGLLRTEFREKFGPISGKIESFEESEEGVRIKCRYSVLKGRALFTRNIFVCWPDEVAIVDSVEVNDVAFSPETVQRFLFGPTLDVRFDERDKLILTSDDFSCTLFQLLDCEGDLYRGEDGSLVRGWFSKKYMEILPTYGVDFVRNAHMSRFSTIIKLAKCASLSECSTTVRSFAGGADPFLSTGVRDSASLSLPRALPDSGGDRCALLRVRHIPMAESSPTRLLIFGSCVSRDILNHQQDKTRLVLVDYYARCSLASLGARPIEMPSAIQNIDSKFQRRMVERDIRKDFLNDLARLQFDVLLLDPIDERFNLYVEPEGRVCTLSSELLSSGFPGDSDEGSRISTGAEEFWRLWEAGWSILVNKLRGLGVLDRLLVNQVFWGSRTEDGGNFEPHYSSKHIDSANQFLDRMYQRISADIPSEQFLRFDHGLMTGSIAHTWGISPFHYVDGYYHSAIQQLLAWSSLKKGISTPMEPGPAALATYSIEQVILEHEHDELVATVVSDASRTGQFAFYLFRNDERIHTQWYSSNPVMRFPIQSEPGLYRVLAFLLSPNGSKITKYSDPLILSPAVDALGQAFKKS